MTDVKNRLEVRLMQEADTAAAAGLEAACFSAPWPQSAFLDALQDKNACYVAAVIDGRIVGICGFWQSLEEADIMNVAVDKEWRSQGIAGKMLQELMRLGRGRGVCAYTLEVRSQNKAAIGLYEKLGFVCEGLRRDFYDDPKDDALIMWKR